jgi:outer membrane lipoprotein SlyB
MNKHTAIASAIFGVAAILGGCASPDYYGTPAVSPYPPPQSSYPVPARSYSGTYGVVDSIQMAPASNGGNGMTGAVVGGVVGGLLGNQVGGGRGRTAATVAGAIGGVMVGNQIEQRNNSQMHNRVQLGIRLDNGAYQTVTQDGMADLQVGSRVRIENDRVYRY